MRQFSAKNPFIRKINIITVDPATGAPTPLVTGVVTGFLSQTRDSAAVAAGAGALTANLVYIGDQAGRADGDWMFTLPATAMTQALLDPLFLNKQAFFVVEKVGVRRVVEEVQYVPQEMATIAA